MKTQSIFIDNLNKVFKIGTFSIGPETLRVFGLKTVQADDYTIKTDAGENLGALTEYALSRMWQKLPKEPLHDIGK